MVSKLNFKSLGFRQPMGALNFFHYEKFKNFINNENQK